MRTKGQAVLTIDFDMPEDKSQTAPQAYMFRLAIDRALRELENAKLTRTTLDVTTPDGRSTGPVRLPL